jgi:hypothetical protein
LLKILFILFLLLRFPAFCSISVRALAKNSSFGFFCVGFRVGKKPNVLFVRLAHFLIGHNDPAKKRCHPAGWL